MQLFGKDKATAKRQCKGAAILFLLLMILGSVSEKTRAEGTGMEKATEAENTTGSEKATEAEGVIEEPKVTEEKVPFDNQQTLYQGKIFHCHTGSQKSYGGCYTNPVTKTELIEVECGGTMVYYPATDTTGCDRCGAGYQGDQSGRKCYTTTQQERSYTAYELGCGMSEQTILATLNVTANCNEWAKEIVLYASYEKHGSISIREDCYIFGTEATKESEWHITENGNYKIKLNAGAGANTEKGAVVVPVQCIDRTGPRASYITNPDNWTTGEMECLLTEAVDLQPDGTAGCGPAKEPFSFDEGKTWTENPKCSYAENGQFPVLVRDQLGNQTNQTISINKIDRTPPEITDISFDTTVNAESTTLTVEARDIQPNQTMGAGLHQEAYSFDGGNTWSSLNTYMIEANQDVTVCVRDLLNNVAERRISITHLDDCGPALSWQMNPDGWTSQPVWIQFTVLDEGTGHGEGIGLGEEFISYDNGITWGADTKFKMEQNGMLTAIVKDLYDNRTKVIIEVNKIDRKPPVVILEYKETDAQSGYLEAKAEDDESGFDEASYSWNHGTYTEQNRHAVTEDGLYTVTVKDKAGNQTTARCFVTRSGTVIEESDSTPDMKSEEIKERETESEEEKKPFAGLERRKTEDEAEKENQQIKKKGTSAIIQKQTETKKHLEQKGAVNLEEASILKRNIPMILCCSLLIIMTVVSALYFIYLNATMRVEAENQKDAGCFLGRVWIHRKKGCWQIGLPGVCIAQSKTPFFRLTTGRLFATLHFGEDLYVFLPDEKYVLTTIEKEIRVQWKEF